MRPTFRLRSALLHPKMVRRGLNALAGCYITPRRRPPVPLCKRLKRERTRKGRNDQVSPRTRPKTSVPLDL